MVPTARPRRSRGVRDVRPGMRFGIKTSPQDTTWADMLAVWQAADEIELFESAWTFDHFYPIFTDDDRRRPAWRAGSPPAALAQATRRLRVGVLVTGMPYRHPAVLANMAATLDIVSGGRLELGIGAGWNEVEAKAYGIDLHATLTERFDAFDEGVRGDHRAAHQRADHVRRSLRAARRRVLQPEAGAAPAPADLHRRTGRAPHAALGGALRAALELPGRSGRAVRGQARRAARALRRPRARPGGDHGVDAPARRRTASTTWWSRRSATATPDSTSASCTCSRRTRPTCSTSSPTRSRRRSPADRSSSRAQRVQPAALRSTQVGQIG